MSDPTIIADRHSRATSGVGDHLKPLSVRLLAGEDLSGLGAQHSLIALTGLLARMVGGVSRIEVDLPPLRLNAFIPGPSSLGDARAQLETLVQWAVGESVPLIRTSGKPCDVTFCIGVPPEGRDGEVDFSVVGAGWRAWVGHPELLTRLSASDRLSANPLGPYFAASMAASEVFKLSRGLLRGRHIENHGYSLWSGAMGPWPALADGPDIGDLTLPAFYLVGTGAVGQGLLNLLAASKTHAEFIVSIDDDTHDGTNLNRCFIAGVEDINHPKTEAVARLREKWGQAGMEFMGTLQKYLSDPPRETLLPELAQSEADLRYALVVSAVDKNTSRQDIQGLGPGRVLAASTLGLTAKANDYRPEKGKACLACHNPPETDGAKLREMEKKVRGLDVADRRNFLDGQVEDLEAVLAYFDSSEGCGTIGEADFRNFALRKEPEFSASFVSMAAAVLLAARLFMIKLPHERLLAREDMSVMGLRNLDGSDETLSQDSTCLHCRAQGRL